MMISRMVRKYFPAFASLFAITFILVMALTVLAEVQQPGLEKRGAQGDMGGTPPPGASTTPGGEMTQGTISGEVVHVDPRAGVIEILSDEGQTQTFKVAEDAKKQLSKIKKGDHVNLNWVLRAVDIRPTGRGGAQQGPSQGRPEQNKHHPGMGR
jgi:hypothetical protein